jgi:hypothetical protein
MIDPRTIPAIAPPDNPDPEAPEPTPAPPVEFGAEEEVLEGKTGGIDTVVGRFTPWQRDCTFAVTQHESVELTVLSAQNEHSPCRLPW